ncbi:MAG TPA: hypothetical protein PLD27_13270 [bacterium]|nr:hypothetical protein [bacterium]
MSYEIINNILEDSKKEAEKIILSAERFKKFELQTLENKLKKIEQEKFNEAENELKKIIEQIKTQFEKEKQFNKLKIEEKILNEILELIKNKINSINISNEKFQNYIISCFKKSEKIYSYSSKINIISSKEIIELIKTNFIEIKNINFIEKPEYNNGFVIFDSDKEISYLLSDIFEYYLTDIKKEILKMLL